MRLTEWIFGDDRSKSFQRLGFPLFIDSFDAKVILVPRD
jgi:hypothetical protein